MKNKKKIISVVGARPQFIKAAAVSRELARHADVQELLLHTGQHYDDNMSDVFFREMQIPVPSFHLGIRENLHGAMTASMLRGIEEVLLSEKPDLVLVYGDTNSTLAGALAARKLNIQLAHVEAGLRSFNMQMPEEINRILTDRISNLLFCPTETAVQNLEKEGFSNFPCTVMNTGDVMQDAAIYYSEISAEKSTVLKNINYPAFILCTLHRAENTDNPSRLKNIVNALNEIHKKIPVILPLHPRTRKILKTSGLSLEVDIIDPIGYFDMIELLKKCRLVMTDSGGLQKEAFFFKKLCVTLRDETEWTELLNHGFNVLAGADTSRILDSFTAMMNKNPKFEMDLYGGGTASVRIVDALLNHS